jgi:hypothetical protein
MLEDLRSARSPLDRALSALPAEYYVMAAGEQYIVVGPTGAFALTLPQPDLPRAARRVARTANALRNSLAVALSWAPFVDAVVVVDGPGGRIDNVGLVPARMLARMITDGPRMLDHNLVSRIAAEVYGLSTAATV